MNRPPKELFIEQGMLALHVKVSDNKVEISIGVETFMDGTEWHTMELAPKEALRLGNRLIESAAYIKS